MDFRFRRYTVSMSPHLRHGRTIKKMIVLFIIALLPAAAWAVFQFGLPALYIIVAAIAGSFGTEALIGHFTKKSFDLKTGYAILAGLVMAMMLPAGISPVFAFIGAALCILIGKAPFGPLGGSPVNPAVVGLLILVLSWSGETTKFTKPANATNTKFLKAAPVESPLQAVSIDPSDAGDYKTNDLFFGNKTGALGTISPLLLLIGGFLLIYLRVVRWQAPFGFLMGVAVLAALLHALAPGEYAGASFHLFTGMTVFGAFFLTTHWSSTPMTPWGMFLFGLIAGVLAVLFRTFGMFYASAPWAIAIMSLATPLFDRITPIVFGKGKNHA